LGFVVDRVALDRFFAKYLYFSVSVSFHQRSILIFVCILLVPEGRGGEAWKPF